MPTSDKITIIIPHANRFANLFICLDSLVEQETKPYEIIVSDFSNNFNKAKEIPDRYGNKLKIKFVHFNKNSFVRGPAINAARQFVKTPLMFILDADIIFNSNGITKILGRFGKPYRKLLLSFRGYRFDKGNKRRRPNHATFNQVYGAFQVYRTEDFDTIGGHNPFMRGWGWQDNDIRERFLRIGCREVIMRETYTHLWHKPSDNVTTCERNKRIASKSRWTGTKWIMGGKRI